MNNMGSTGGCRDKTVSVGHPEAGARPAEQALGLYETMIDFLDLPEMEEDSIDCTALKQGLSDQAASHAIIKFSTVREELLSEQESSAEAKDGLEGFDSAGSVRACESSPDEVFPALDQLPAPDRGADRASEIYESIVAFLKGTFAGNLEDVKGISIDRACSVILAIVNSATSRDEWYKTVSKTAYSLDSKDFLIFHHANAAIFTICLGMTLELSREELCRVGICALFHDIGKLLVPDEILFKRGKLSGEEWKILRNYPYESYKILSALGSRFDIAAQCALQVNERMDGSGFPRGLKAESIHPYAQMIGLVDVYEAMTSNRPYRPKLLHYDAVKEILKTSKAAFARSYITALLKTFSIFPLHSCVKLSSGVMGRIVEVNKSFPMRPKVEVLFDAAGMQVPVPFLIDLSKQSFLYIEAPVPESELPEPN